MSFEDNNQQEQPVQEAKVRKLPSKQPAVATAPKAAPQEKMMLIPEASVNQLLTAISQLKGLDWATVNPLMVFIQQNVKPFNPPTTS